MRNREEFSFKAYYPFDRLNGYYVTSKQGRLEIYSSVCMLYDAQGRLSNFFLINIDNTEINRAHSRIAEFESSFSLVSRFGKVGYCRFDLVSKEGMACRSGIITWARRRIRRSIRSSVCINMSIPPTGLKFWSPSDR